MTNEHTIQSLWVGERLSRIEVLSIRSFLAQGHPYHLYTYADLENVPDGVTVKDANAIVPERDIFKTDLSKASVVTMYLLPEYNAVLKPTLLALKPGTRIVSHDYGIADWEPDAKEKVLVPEKPVGVDKASWIYYWMVPAQVEGSWRSRIPAAKGTADLELKITQRYQKFDGTARIGASTFAIERPVLKGTEISFDIIDGRQTLHFAGRVSEGRLSGQVTAGGRKHPWSAQKVEPSKV